MIDVIPDGPVSEDAVRAFEHEHGLQLPAEYRDWLKATGGGETARDYRVQNGMLSEFVGLGTAGCPRRARRPTRPR